MFRCADIQTERGNKRRRTHTNRIFMLLTVRTLPSSCCEMSEEEQRDDSEPKNSKDRRKRAGETEQWKEGDPEGGLTVRSLIASAETMVVCPAN